MDLAGLKKLVPSVDWEVVLAGVGLGDEQHFIVNETTAHSRRREAARQRAAGTRGSPT